MLLTALVLTLAAQTSDASLYLLPGRWSDARAQTTTLAALQGQPVVLAMFYTSCRGVCPLLISDMKAIEARLAPAVRDKVRFVLVSFDPKRDTPAALLKVADERGLDAKRWTLLTGSDDDVRLLAAALGMKYRVAGSEFLHASVITVLDGKGEIVRQEGPPRDAAAMAALVGSLVR